MSCTREQFDVRTYVYSAPFHPCSKLDFSDDQFAFRPTTSLMATIVVMLYTVHTMLTENDSVHIFSFDFSKTLDTIRHAGLTTKLADREMLVCVFNWVIDLNV